MNITKQQIEDGRKSYEEFQKGMSGGFYTALFQAIASAKGENIYKMALGFPGEVYAYREYIGGLDPYYWDIEGETAAEKFNRLTAKPEQIDFHYNGIPLSEEDLQEFNGIIEAIVNDIKGTN
ncbi:hypothetical protein ABKP09_19625 [Peribacillus frigoritolerans]|uniref:hypothetical protein n=1 Tax=Peribacillus frigoritolerans TaxID=450367 RepID=UPI0032B52D69